MLFVKLYGIMMTSSTHGTDHYNSLVQHQMFTIQAQGCSCRGGLGVGVLYCVEKPVPQDISAQDRINRCLSAASPSLLRWQTVRLQTEWQLHNWEVELMAVLERRTAVEVVGN